MMKMSKRILAVLLALLLPLLLAVPALALDSYELFARWEQDGYPEDVTGVFYNTETKCLAVVLTENTEARQKELRDTLTDGETLTFFAGEYSHAQLAECAAAITKDMEENGLAGTVSILESTRPSSACVIFISASFTFTSTFRPSALVATPC